MGIPGNRETAHFGERNKKNDVRSPRGFFIHTFLQFIYKVQAVNNMILKTRASQPPDAEEKKKSNSLGPLTFNGDDDCTYGRVNVTPLNRLNVDKYARSSNKG